MKRILYTLAFIEGLLVMALELLCARLTTPYYGSSIYVWTSVIGITMLALLMGYYLGGVLVTRQLHKRLVIPFIIVAAGWVSILHVLGSIFLEPLLGLGLIGGALMSMIFLLAAPLILLGAISPQLIQLISESGVLPGRASGNVYTISTLGGVLGTFLTGLLLIPAIGIKSTALAVGIVSLLFPLAMITFNKTYRMSFFLTIPVYAGVLLGSFYSSPQSKILGGELLYSSEGILGHLTVEDIHPNFRAFSNDGITQSIIEKNEKASMLLYTHVMATVSSLNPPERRKYAALIGMAGGSLIRELQHLNYQNIYAIDIDPRTKKLAEDYFWIDPASYQFVEDDGRHFLATTNQTFNIIMIDVSLAEEQPWHLFTKEAFELYKSKLEHDGILVLNIIDFYNLDDAIILARIGDSMLNAGFETRVIKDFYNHIQMEQNSIQNIAHEKILVGLKDGFRNTATNVNELNSCCSLFEFNRMIKEDLYNRSFIKNTLTLGPFYDDQPDMEYLGFERVNLLRTKYRQKVLPEIVPSGHSQRK